MGSAAPASRLFEPLQIGANKLSTRVVMAPLTRFRANDDHVPLPFVKEYYAQRASVPGTLIITEATQISALASGYPNIPRIDTPAQIAAWKEVVDVVHAKGCFIWMQLWALGRVASKELKIQEGTGDVVGPSPIPYSDHATVPRELTEDEIKVYVEEYAQAAKNAIEGAGFDGVEVHGANGYLVDQFIQDVSNTRTDKYGGSVENRARFPLQIAEAIVKAVGAEKTGFRLSPWSTFQAMKMADPVPQFSYIVKGLKDLKLAYLHLVESRVAGSDDLKDGGNGESNAPFAEIWGETSPILFAGGFKPANAKKFLDEEHKGKNYAVVFGRYFVSNPDLVYRLEHDIELNHYDRDTFYKAKSTEGYLDQPFSKEFLAEHKL